MTSTRPLLMLGGLLSILALGGRSTLTSETAQVKPRAKVVVGSFEPIAASCKDTPETQIAVAKHNAMLDSIRSGKAVKYQAPCEAAPKEDKTS